MSIITFALIIVSCSLENVYGAVARVNENNDASFVSSVLVCNDADCSRILEKKIDRSHRDAFRAPWFEPFHGFVSYPPSRANLCSLRVNKNCGRVIYEPQSIEGSKGFPYGYRSPPDGKIASGANPDFEMLNEYGQNRWNTVQFPEVRCFNATHLYFNLTWTMTAPHSTDSIRVFASNEKYTTTEPLSRRHLDLNPICSIKLYGAYPPTTFKLQCAISKERY